MNKQPINLLSIKVKSKATELGFELVGVTTHDPPPHLDVYTSWLGSERHGTMGYLATTRVVERRSDPRLILPECQSILMLGIRHHAPRPAKTTNIDPLRGRSASYAWGEDYHKTLKPRLKALVQFIEEQVGEPVPNRWYTDTGPILERELAQRAGLGWIGKNTCLINPDSGSYFILAEVLLGIELVPDEPVLADHCGSCTRCIEACPTQCILPDRTIEARQCISYLTIELKDEIPLDLRPKMGEWVFGCDICQEVCPWNIRFSQAGGDAAFAPRPDVPEPDLLADIQLEANKFSEKFWGSPVKRPGRAGYLRNVAIALGNSRDPRAVPGLRQALLSDPSPLVRAHAAWALGQIAAGKAEEALQEALISEEEKSVLDEIRLALRS